MPISPAEWSLRSRMGVKKSWAHTPDWSARTSAARAGRMKKFEQQVDPEGVLSPEERTKRARMAMQSHMESMSLKAAEARRKKREARDTSPDAAA